MDAIKWGRNRRSGRRSVLGNGSISESMAVELPEGTNVRLLPKCWPQLNQSKNLWHDLRSHFLSNWACEE